jgi:predicted ATPase
VDVRIARVDASLTLGLGSTLVDEIRALGALAPYDERVCGQLMVALYRAGKQAEALEELRRFRKRLQDDLGLAPGPELIDLEARILVHDAGLLIPIHLRLRRRDNLPEDVARFIGRKRELDDIHKAVARSRLTTVTGAGGAGKTRLAIAAARALIDEYSDGVWLVELASLADPSWVPRTIAATVGARAGDLEGLATELDDRNLLIILDNCEHLIDTVANVAAVLLQRCRTLRILSTSREPLAIEGELVYRIPPLALQPGGNWESAAHSDAVRLFVDRASLQGKEFVLDGATTPTVLRICERVDGLPLAIELAAARLSSLSLEAIAQMLSERLSLLSGSHRRAVARQQTITALVDWSYDLLRDDAKEMLEVLSVFAGGFTLDAVAAVTASEPVELVTELVDKSLVEVIDNESGRFRLLETIREYATEHLAARGAGTFAGLRNAHADYYLRLAVESAPILDGGGRDQASCLHRLMLEHDNLRAATGTLRDHARWIDGLVMVSSLRLFWDMGSHFQEGAAVATALLEQADPAESPHDYGMGLCAAADLCESFGDLVLSDHYARRAAGIGDATGDLELAIHAASKVSDLQARAGYPRRALDGLRPFPSRALKGIDSSVVQRLLRAEGYAALQCEDWDLARTTYAAILDLSTETGNVRRGAMAHLNLSVADMAVGDLPTAAARLERV